MGCDKEYFPVTLLGATTKGSLVFSFNYNGVRCVHINSQTSGLKPVYESLHTTRAHWLTFRTCVVYNYFGVEVKVYLCQ